MSHRERQRHRTDLARRTKHVSACNECPHFNNVVAWSRKDYPKDDRRLRCGHPLSDPATTPSQPVWSHVGATAQYAPPSAGCGLRRLATRQAKPEWCRDCMNLALDQWEFCEPLWNDLATVETHPLPKCPLNAGAQIVRLRVTRTVAHPPDEDGA